MCARELLRSHSHPPVPIQTTLFTFFLFASVFFSFIYVCTFLAWLYNVSHRSPFFVSLCVCVCKLTCDARGGRSDPISPIHDYIPTWYHGFIYNNMQYFLIPFNSYRFLIIIFSSLFFPFRCLHFSSLLFPFSFRLSATDINAFNFHDTYDGALSSK